MEVGAKAKGKSKAAISRVPGQSTTQESASIDLLKHTNDDRQAGSTRLNITGQGTPKHGVISRTMPIAQVVKYLVYHRCPNITEELDLDHCSTIPVSSGGFGDVYRGVLRTGVEVALKCLRIYVGVDKDAQKALKYAAKELYAWSKCKHNNIVKLLGLAVFRGQIAMVSLWMDNGSINQLNRDDDTINRYELCAQITTGLAYLHSIDIVHGDLKGANVLLSKDGVAQLTDFGNAVLGGYTLDFTGSATGSSLSTRWAAPEQLEATVVYSSEADVYSLGMTILEVISRQLPYANIKADYAVIAAVLIKKTTPERPKAVLGNNPNDDTLWDLLQNCWARNPDSRPKATDANEVMSSVVRGRQESADSIDVGGPNTSARSQQGKIDTMSAAEPYRGPGEPQRRNNAGDPAMQAHAKALEEARKLLEGEMDEDDDASMRCYVGSKFGGQSGQDYGSESETSDDTETSEPIILVRTPSNDSNGSISSHLAIRDLLNPEYLPHHLDYDDEYEENSLENEPIDFDDIPDPIIPAPPPIPSRELPSTSSGPLSIDSVIDQQSPSRTHSPDVTEADVARAAQHREAFEWAEQAAKDRVAQGDDGAPYIFNGFPTWLNWDLFTRLENTERQKNGEALLPRVSSDTRPEMLKLIYEEWHNVRDKWVDRFWDPRWAVFVREVGGPIQTQLAEERQTPGGRNLEAARVYQRENSELPLAKREFSRGYLWDEGYTHQDWWWIPEKAWRWTLEHENDERRARGRAPLPRYHPGMGADDWRDVRDVWHTTASKWAEKRKDTEWLARDKREGVTPERRGQLEQQFLRSRQQHKAIREASGQRPREALRPEERDKIRHDSAMELLARMQEAYKRDQAVGAPWVSEAEAERRRQAQRDLEELMRTPAMTHPRPANGIGHASKRRGEGNILYGGSSAGHSGPARDAWGNRMPGEPDEDSDPYDSTSSEDQPPVGINQYTRAPNGFPPPPLPEPLPEWLRREKTSDPPSSSIQSVPGRNPSVPSVSKTKKPGILKDILKRTLSIQRNNSNQSESRKEASPVNNSRAGVFLSADPDAGEPIRFDRNHPFSMTSPHPLDYEGKPYPSAIHLWHALRFLRQPMGRGQGRSEESFHPELSESIRNASEPELLADQWAHAGAIGKDGIMRSLQRPDWEEVQMEKMDEVLGLKFTQHPELRRMLVSTHPAELLYMWDGPWGVGVDLRGPNNLGKAVMRCRGRLLRYALG